MATMPPTPDEATLKQATPASGAPSDPVQAPVASQSPPAEPPRPNRRPVRIVAIIVVWALVLGIGAALLLRYLYGEQLAAQAPATGETTVRQFATAATRHDEETVSALVVPGFTTTSAASVFDPGTFLAGDPAIAATSDLVITFHTSALSASATADTSGVEPAKASAAERATEASVRLQLRYAFRVGGERHQVSTDRTVTLIRQFLNDEGIADENGRWPSRWLIQDVIAPDPATVTSDLSTPGGTECSEAQIVHTIEAAMLRANTLGSTCLAAADIATGESIDDLTHNAVITAEPPAEITGLGSDNAYADRTGTVNGESPGGPLLEHVLTAGGRQFIVASAIADKSAWIDPNVPEYRVFAVTERAGS